MDRDAISRLLTQHGVQVTAQRLDIAQYVLSRPQHVSAEQILAAMRARGSGVSKATVYNTMNLFSERGLVRTVEVDPERLYYDSTTEPHYHFYNVDTGELTDIPSDQVHLALDTDLPGGTEQAGVDIVVRIRSVVH
jgi:Fur family iron response transcriptional regulator